MPEPLSRRTSSLKVGSVCSGAGGFDLGFRNAGYATTWLCEFDPWRQQLLAQNFPGVPCHPDLSTLDPDDLEPVDVLIGGTPCQDLSVAGQRAGLDGERSGLFWDYCRIRNALNVPWCVWENVAGALSSNGGLDFASVLGAFVGADVAVPADGWPGAGVVAGPWGGACWRVLDAQHFGVPQRRRRVFVVGHLGGPCPPEVLLESAGGSGDLAASGQARPRVAASLTRGSSGSGVSAPGRRQEDDINLVAGPLTKRYAKGINTTCDDGAMVAHTLRGAGFDASEDGTGRGTPLTLGVPLDAGPDQRRCESVDGEGQQLGCGQHRGSDSQERSQGTAGDGCSVEPDQRRRQARAGVQRGADRVHGAPADTDGVRAPDGLARRMDDPASAWDSLNHAASDITPTLGANTGQATGRAGVVSTGTLAPAEASAYDPQPDGRRYAACGDGVVAPVATWIGRRLMEVASV